MSKVICVVGPTASGKTSLAVALAHALDGEVISADSMQIYKQLDIGTAKPTRDEMQGVPHHMLSIAQPDEVYSVARYVEKAQTIAHDIQKRGKVVIIAGGTGLYVDSFVKGLDFSTATEDGTIRERLSDLYDRRGAVRLHQLLQRRDAAAAARIHANDKRRVVRALEVTFYGGSISQHNRATSARPPRYDALYIGLNYHDRAQLYRRCEQRVDIMLQSGLLDEVRMVREHADTWRTAMQAIGYKELFVALDNPELLPLAVEELKQSTRRYAKRQLTWLRRNEQIRWIYRDLTADDALLHISTEYAKTFLYNG